ncbi:MAG TPA: hypothetical protein VM580_24620 [Labilithrix sp.]|jgi:hypothetical protein|nr:hypothetical protein [Labilithrix sp.]
MTAALWVLGGAQESVLIVAMCPRCPTNTAARELFLAEDLLMRFGGSLAPFVLAAALVALVVNRIARERPTPNDGPKAGEEDVDASR